METEHFQIYNEDCFDTFKRIKDKSLNLVIVDLPYGQTKCKWDIIIPFDKMWDELKRIIKPNANLLFFCSTKFGIELINSNPKWFRYDIVWEKTRPIGFLNANRSILRNHEMIYLFGKPSGGKKIYNPQMTKGNPYKKKGEGKKDGKIYSDNLIYLNKNNKGVRYPVSVQKFPNPNNHSYHPTQKPLDLYEWLIKTFSNEGDLVCDFCLGSGTGLFASLKTNRKFIGCELNKDYFDKILINLKNKID